LDSKFEPFNGISLKINYQLRQFFSGIPDLNVTRFAASIVTPHCFVEYANEFRFDTYFIQFQ